MKYEFDAIPGGDGECFCFNVDKETYIKLLGQKAFDDEIIYQKEFAKEVECEFIEPTKFQVFPHEFFGEGKKHIKIEVVDA